MTDESAADFAEFPVGAASSVEAVSFDGERVTELVIRDGGAEWVLSGEMDARRRLIPDE